MSNLYDANQSPLRVAHRHLSENDRFYRISVVAAPIALVVALVAGTLSIIWRPSPPLPQAAVPVQPPSPAQPAPQTVNLLGLRDRATSDAAALDELRSRAGGGNAEAQFYMGTLYDPLMSSVRFAKNAVTAADWYEKSASQSYAFAQNNLGWLYQNGQGKPQDYSAAAGWYRKAADQGDAVAQVNLGVLYETGRGVVKDETEAARWYRMAANLDNSAAWDYLGHLYESGRGAAKDEAEAARWYRKAADAGVPLAQADLGRMYEAGRGVPRDISEAVRWYQKAADQNNRSGENELGRIYAAGEGVPRNLERALALFRRAAASGDPSGVFNLALALDDGWGASRNPLAAYIWYTIATRWGAADRQSQAEMERRRLSRELTPDELGAAQRAADNWQPGSHGRIGVAIDDLTADRARAMGSMQTRGTVITKLEDGSPALRAGLAVQDVVTAIDGQPVGNAADFRELIWLGVPGQTVTLWVEKERQRGSLQNVRLQLDRAPPGT